MSVLKNSVTYFAFVLLALVFLFAPKLSLAAFGISPPFIHATYLVPGANFKQVIYLVRDVAESDLPIQATLETDDVVKSWITLDNGFDFIIPQGVRQFPVEVRISVPKDAPLALNKANIRFVSKPSDSGQVAIALGAQASIDIKVGNEIYEKYTPTVDLADIEEGWDPKVTVRIVNEGNIPQQFTGATYELLDKFGAVRLAYVQKSDGFPKTEAFSTNSYTIDFPVNFELGLGEYWGKVDFYQNEKLIVSQKTVFNVLPRGSLSSPSSQILAILQDYWMYIAGFLAVVVVGFFVRLLLRKRRG